jgi:hypothetical protein
MAGLGERSREEAPQRLVVLGQKYARHDFSFDAGDYITRIATMRARTARRLALLGSLVIEFVIKAEVIRA